MIKRLSVFPRHYLAACVLNAAAAVALPSLGLRTGLADLYNSWMFTALALIASAWSIGIGVLEAMLLRRTHIYSRAPSVVRAVAGFLSGGLFAWIGYLLASSTLSPTSLGQAPSRLGGILLAAFGVAGICCWVVGLLLPLAALRSKFQ